MYIPGDVFEGSLTEQMTRGAVMRKNWALAAAVVGASAALAAPAGLASADDGKNAQQVISDLQSQGYTVNIDRVGTAPMSECAVTNVRNPQSVQQWVPYIGPGAKGFGGNRALVLQTISQSISVTLDCSRH
jgi:hypothetical protein